MDANTEKLEAFLRDLTLSAVARNAEGEQIESLIVSIDAAVRSRRIVDCVQFEELWEDKIDGASDPYLFINAEKQRSAALAARPGCFSCPPEGPGPGGLPAGGVVTPSEGKLQGIPKARRVI